MRHHSSTRLPPLTSLEWLQGSPADLQQELQLCLLMQPNCPGCIQYAIPTANTLFSQGNRDFNVYCISTAFEDFEYNTFESANKLLSGKLVGASKQALGETTTSGIPQMPLARDIVVKKSSADSSLVSMALNATRQHALKQANGMNIPPDTLRQALSNIRVEVLPEQIARVFYTVSSQGTPTWILHDARGRVLDSRFGHYSAEQLAEWIDEIRQHA